MINTSDKVVFHVVSRDLNNQEDKVKNLRKQNKVPGNVYGLGKDSQAVYMDYQAINKLYDTQGDTGLIYLQVGDIKKNVPVLIDELDYSSIDNKMIHVTFKRVSLKEKIEADVSIELIGEAKVDNGIVATLKDTVTVEALPADLPEKFEIDISELSEIGQIITVADLKIDKNKVTFVLGEDENPTEMTLIMIQEVKEEVEPEETEGEEAGEETIESTEDKPVEESTDSETKTD